MGSVARGVWKGTASFGVGGGLRDSCTMEIMCNAGVIIRGEREIKIELMIDTGIF
jgi:hypothetical protein